jgi:GT2 family glycosyltransferase
MTAHDVVAVVVTHRRPRLATRTVRSLIDDEGFAPADVVLVCNGEGGLDDEVLEAAVDAVRLPVNLGPAGGFAAGLARAAARGAEWIYLCEDDIALFDLPRGRVARVLAALDQRDASGRPVGGVVASGRDLDRRTGITVPHVTNTDGPLEPVDTAAWGATLVSRAVVDAGVQPDPSLYFGYEDFDFWYRMQDAGFALLVDTASAAALAGVARDMLFDGERPTDSEEGWRAYYVARNFFELARRHGRWTWQVHHLGKSIRRYQLAADPVTRRAVVDGVLDGVRRRVGPNPAYRRDVGEI